MRKHQHKGCRKRITNAPTYEEMRTNFDAKIQRWW